VEVNCSTARLTAAGQIAASDATNPAPNGKGNHTMHASHRSRLGRIAVVASGAMLLLAGHAFAQTVQMFDDAPSLEQLRSIMIPESRPGLSRTIVIQRPDTTAMQTPVQTVSSQVTATPRPPVARANQPAPQPIQAAVSTPEPPPIMAPPTTAPQADPAADAGVVGFHINFAFDSARLPESAHTMIDRIAQLMKEAPQVKLRVEGHTDATGSAGYNVSLSERRALSVGEYLVKQGIEPSRLILVGKGMSEPLTRNPYEPTNRRVQFVRIG
jgi:outer membrane protein OmpA-like peptidoglycan-associated protein